MAKNPAQQIVEVVGDAAGEGPDTLQAARVPQAAFQPRALRFHRMTRDGVEDGVECHAQETEFARRGDTTRAAYSVKTKRGDRTIRASVGHAGPAADTNSDERASDFTTAAGRPEERERCRLR